MWSDLFFGPLLQGQTRVAKLKSACNSLVMGPRVLELNTNLLEIMDWGSSHVVRFDPRPLILMLLILMLIIGPRGVGCETSL